MGVPTVLEPLEPPSLLNECECEELVRPQRAGLSDAKKDDVFELLPKRERDDDDEPEEPLVLPLGIAGFVGVADDGGVFRLDEPIK